jgi:hypothetical protein
MTVIGPDRVTFEPGFTARPSIFEWFKASAAPAPQPDPYRFLMKRLGMTKEIFEATLAREVDDFLTESAEERLQAQERILTKDDCIFLLRNTVIPPFGQLQGIWRWAADLGHARYNFEAPSFEEHVKLLVDYD